MIERLFTESPELAAHSRVLSRPDVELIVERILRTRDHGAITRQLDIADTNTAGLSRALLSFIPSNTARCFVVWPQDREGIDAEPALIARFVDDLWYPSRDDVWIGSSGEPWLVELNHEEFLALWT